MTKQLKNQHAFHGGNSFASIGYAFEELPKSKTIIRADVLDAWFPPTPKALRKMKQYLAFILKASPPTHSEGLIQTISHYQNIPQDNILVGGGSSDIMFILFPQLLQRRDRVLILDPMYGEYAHIFERVIHNHVSRFVLPKENNFTLPTDKFIRTIKTLGPKLVAMVNPNSPTGQLVEKSQLLHILKSIPKQTYFLIDEAYIDYANPTQSMEQVTRKFPNLIVLKTMSKAYALSGARVGYMIANKKIINTIKPHTPPWAVSTPAQVAAIEALKDQEYYTNRYAQTKQLTQTLVKQLRQIKEVKTYDTNANYVLIEIIKSNLSAEQVVHTLAQKNVFVRNCDSMSAQFKNRFIRIAVQDAKANEMIIEALKLALAK